MSPHSHIQFVRALELGRARAGTAHGRDAGGGRPPSARRRWLAVTATALAIVGLATLAVAT